MIWKMWDALYRIMRGLADLLTRLLFTRQQTVAELLRWHAEWERANPHLIVHASYAEHLPPPLSGSALNFANRMQQMFEPPKIRVTAPPARVELVSTDIRPPAKIPSANSRPKLRVRPPDPHDDAPCDHCVTMIDFGQPDRWYICNATKEDA